MKFDIIPAIDLLDQEAVRLHKGSYAEKTVYSREPAALAHTFIQSGCKRIHVVDLNAARNGERTNAGVLKAIVEAAAGNAKVQTGGGIRSLEAAEQCFSLGVSRVIVGTKAAKDPDALREFLHEFGPERIVVGVDAKDGQVMVQGWEESSGRGMTAFLQLLEELGVRTVVATNIASDGTLEGVSLAFYREILASCALEIIVSGGVGSIADVDRVQTLGSEKVTGLIVGKAYYEGRIDLREAVKRAGT